MTERSILAVFAHPDDETTSCAGTFFRCAAQGAKITLVTATRGEQGSLGTGGQVIRREELGTVREQEQRQAVALFGVGEIIHLGYIDGAVNQAPPDELEEKVLAIMGRVQPDSVITFGPRGISHHEDHISIHQATTSAFHKYVTEQGGGRAGALGPLALYYVAISKEIVAQLGFDLEGVETQPNIVIDVSAQRDMKVRALKMYRSQEDAQEVAGFMQSASPLFEWFYQVHPPVSDHTVKGWLW